MGSDSPALFTCTQNVNDLTGILGNDRFGSAISKDIEPNPNRNHSPNFIPNHILFKIANLYDGRPVPNDQT